MPHWCKADANPTTTINSQSTLSAIKLFALTAYFGSPMPTISNPHRTHLFCYEQFYYQAYRWMFFYYFHTLSSSQTCATMPHDAENFRHILHRCITPWQKIPFLFTNQSTTTLHSSHVIRASPKSSHYFGTHEPSSLLGIIFLHHFAVLSFVILKFLLWISLYSVHRL